MLALFLNILINVSNMFLQLDMSVLLLNVSKIVFIIPGPKGSPMLVLLLIICKKVSISFGPIGPKRILMCNNINCGASAKTNNKIIWILNKMKKNKKEKIIYSTFPKIISLKTIYPRKKLKLEAWQSDNIKSRLFKAKRDCVIAQLITHW